MTPLNKQLEHIHSKRLSKTTDVGKYAKWVDKGDRLELWTQDNELLKTKFK